MNIRNACLGLSAAFLLAFETGCGKSGSAPSAAPSELSSDTLVRVHWLGKRRLGNTAGAYYFMRIWNLPESTRLEAQSVDKLSIAPWRYSGIQSKPTEASTALLKVLLYDVIQEECYFEIRQSADQPPEAVLAIRLDSPRDDRWETNLAAVLESLTGNRPTPLQDQHRGWVLKQERTPQSIKLNRVGEWMVTGTGQQKTVLFDEIVDRIDRQGTPFSDSGSNHWLQADLDLPRLTTLFPNLTNFSGDLPKITVTLNGDGGNVITRGDLVFPRPLSLQLDPWIFPTNRIIEPIVSFSAARGFGSWLNSWKSWEDLQIGPPPNQFCLWAPDGAPQQMIFTAPSANASNQVYSLTERLTQSANPWLIEHGSGKLEAIPNANGVIWADLPMISPFIRTVNEGHTILGATRTDVATGTNFQSTFFYHPTLPELLGDLTTRSNLVWYDWELSAPRVDSSLLIGQVLRIGLGRPQLPVASASLDWLRMIRIRLGNCTTILTAPATNQLSFYRKSSVGFTGAELQFLTDWLESPDFPGGLYSTRASVKK